jgi:hypothetical protein
LTVLKILRSARAFVTVTPFEQVPDCLRFEQPQRSPEMIV